MTKTEIELRPFVFSYKERLAELANNLNIVRIFTGVFEYNIASQKVLEKNGCKKEALFKNAIYKNEKVLNEVRLTKLK